MHFRSRIFEIIDKAKPGDRASSLFDTSIIVLIILNICGVILSSFNDLSFALISALRVFEIFSVTLFTIEYFLRFWTSDLLYRNSKRPHLRFAFSFMALIDLFSILPFYIPFIIPYDLRFLRLLRLFRLFRILKLNRYSSAMSTIGTVLKKEREKLLTTVFITSLLILFAASIMYYVETEAQPDKFTNIISSIWWAVATLTTVGYGDIYPITTFGKLLSGIIAILGIGLVALPTAIISSGFINEVSQPINHHKVVCPHCGKTIESIK